MTEAIIVAALSFLGTMCGAWFAHRKSSALVAYRLQELEEKVDKHNQLIERTYKLEQAGAILAEQMKVANHRISDLER